MKRAPQLAVAMLTACMIFVAGCAGGPGWFGGGNLASRNQASPFASAGVGQKPAAPTPGQAILAAFKRSGEKFADAFKPKVIPAKDPIELSNQPEKVDPGIYAQAAQLFENKGDVASAVGQYEQALKVDPHHLGSLLGLARLYDRQEDFAKATSYYQRAAKAHPNNAVVLNDLGLCYARQRDLQSSAMALRQAVDADPTSKLYRNNLATVLVERSEFEEALGQFTAAHGKAIAHFNLGLLLSKKGHPELAVDNLQQALRHDPSMEQARQLLAQFDPPQDEANTHQAQTPSAFSIARNAPDENTTYAPVVTPSEAQSGGEFPPVRLPEMRMPYSPGSAKTPPLPGDDEQPHYLPPVE